MCDGDNDKNKYVERDNHIQDKWPKTLGEATDCVLNDWHWSDESRATFRDTPRDGLSCYHHGLGTAIRNEFGLWTGNTALLIECGHREMHADEASSVILQAVWNRLHDIPVDDARLKDYRTEREVYRDLGPEKSYLKLLRYTGSKEFAGEAIGLFFGLNQEQVAGVTARAELLQ